MKFPHTHFTRGQRVRVVLRDGTVLVERFVERHARSIELTNGERHVFVPTKSLKSVTIFRAKSQ